MSELAVRIRDALGAAADPVRAPGQQAYMKSEMPFLGVPVPEVRRIARSAARGITDPEQVLEAAVELWDAASHREERYAAMALLSAAALRDHAAMLPTVEHMVRSGRWWDFTDELAHRVAAELDAHPEETAAIVRAWATDEDMWMRRISIISQLGRRDRLDRALLTEVVEPNVADPEFFIRKAIGWALRELARTDPEWVRTFVDARALSPLSRREALKHLG